MAPRRCCCALLVVVAEEQGVPRDRSSGTLQNDILKEFIAQNEFIYPPQHSIRLVVDTIEFCRPRDAALESCLA